MLVSYVTRPYRLLVEKAFCEFLLALRFVTPFPNTDRFARFLTRIKSDNPDIDNPELCRHGLPDNWCYIQYSRGALKNKEDEDEFREGHLRTLTKNLAKFQEYRYTFGYVDLDFWLVANNGPTVEACEAFYYMRLHKLRSIDYVYLDMPFKSRVEHETLDTFESLQLQSEHGTGYVLTWRVRIDVPIFTNDITGFTVQSHQVNIFDRGDVSLPLGTIYTLHNIPDEIDNPDEPLEALLERKSRLKSTLEVLSLDQNDNLIIE